MTNIRFDGQSVIVTGAGRGLGRAYAREFARRGADVVVNDIDPDSASAVVEEITLAGGQATAAPYSVATTNGAANTVDAAMRRVGRVDVLVNNAGILRTGYLADLTEDDIDDVIDVHLRAAFRMTRLVWPHMTARGYGRVIMTSSASGMFSHQGLSSYAAAKAGLYGLTKALAFEGRERGINVNAILPNATTPATETANIPDMAEYFAQYIKNPVSVPEWRWHPATVAALVAYLASIQCECTGEAFSAVEGRYARVFVGVANGWLAPDETAVSAENIADHFSMIQDINVHGVPMWLYDEFVDIGERLRPAG